MKIIRLSCLFLWMLIACFSPFKIGFKPRLQAATKGQLASTKTAKRQSEEFDEEEKWEELGERQKLLLDIKACKEAGVDHCQEILAALQGSNRYYHSLDESGQENNRKTIFSAFLAALGVLAKTNSHSRQFVPLAYWCDVLGNAWHPTLTFVETSKGAGYFKISSEGQAALNLLQPYRVKYTEYWHDGYHLERSILKRLALDHEDAFWGQEAFAEMSNLGWVLGDPCWHYEAPTNVIRHGEEFLKRFRDSPVYDSVLLDVGQAYSILWENSVANPQEFAVGFLPVSKKDGENARLKAIKFFDEFLRRGRGIKGLIPEDYSEFYLTNCEGSKVDIKLSLKNLQHKKPFGSSCNQWWKYRNDCD